MIMTLSTEKLLLILGALILIGAVSSYVIRKTSGRQHPNHLIGALVMIVVIVIVARMLGFHTDLFGIHI
jgi:hypothetical protein